MGQNQNQEIDIVYIYRAFGKLLTNIGLTLYSFLMFIKRNVLIICAILVVGVGLGYYLDSTRVKLLRHDFIVVPNFGSADFLYEAFDNNSFINTKLSTNEWLDLKDVKKIKILPVVDIYNLLKNNKYALELFTMVTERGSDVNAFIENESTRKNYKYHLLSIYTSGTRNTDEIVREVFEQLNSQDYYLKKQAIAKVQNLVKKQANQRSLEQMDNILDNLGAADSRIDLGGISIKNSPDIEKLFMRKNSILDDLVMLDEEILEQQNVVYVAGKMMNNVDEYFWDRKIIMLPFTFILLFFGGCSLRNFIRKFKTLKESRTN